MADGFFRSKSGFTVVQNEITRNKDISLKAKGLYLVIQSYITMQDKKWCKSDFMNMTCEGEKAFDGAWKELKENGYLKVHMFSSGTTWTVEYELLDEAKEGPHSFYYNSKGELVRTNIDRAVSKNEKISLVNQPDGIEKTLLNEYAEKSEKTLLVNHEEKNEEASLVNQLIVTDDGNNLEEDNLCDESLVIQVSDEKSALKDENSRYPKKGVTEKNAENETRYHHFGRYGNGRYGNGSNGNGGNINNKDLSINTVNKDSVNNKNIKSYQSSEEQKNLNGGLNDGCDVSSIRENIKEQIGFDEFMTFRDPEICQRYEEMYNIICDILCVPRKYVRINGEDYPYELVREQFLKLTHEHLVYVEGIMSANMNRVTNIRAYLITALYNAANTYNNYKAQSYREDFGTKYVSDYDMEKYREKVIRDKALRDKASGG